MHETVAYFKSLLDKVPEETSWETVATVIRGEYLREKTLAYRKALAESNNPLMSSIKHSCPGIICQVHVEDGRNSDCILGYTGTFMADFDHLEPDKIPEMVSRIRADKHTMFCYTTISGKGLRVIAKVDSKVTEKNFAAAWRTVNEHYKRLVGEDYDKQCSNTTRMCGLAWDPHVYFNPIARRMRIDYSLGDRPKKKSVGRPVMAKTVSERVRNQVERDGAVYAEGHHNDYVMRCVYLMNRYGVKQDDCTDWALGSFEDYDATHPGAVRGIVKNVYLKYSDEHGCLSAAKHNATVSEIQEYINNHYKMRHNKLSFKVEYAQLTDSPSPDYNIIDDRFVNSLWRQMQLDNVSTDLQTLNTIIGSNFVPEYHPFRLWIENLPPWDGKTDYIGQFFSLVHCKNVSDREYRFYTRCWFLAMVASVLDDKVVNHEILTFIGAQGTYKSSFMLNILPTHLRAYYATKNNSYQLDKDDYIMLAENIIISLEEIDAMDTRQINQLKAFTTLPQIKERMPYGRHKVIMPRVASLCATGNNLTFLADQTGNRRWLPFNIDHIDNPWKADIPYEGMYAQAFALIKSGENFWLDNEQIKQLNEHNCEFQTPDPATEMIVTYYTIPRTEAETKYMTSSKIAARFAPLMKISPTKIGIALAALGFEQVRSKKGRFWKVAERPAADIDGRLPDENRAEDLPF